MFQERCFREHLLLVCREHWSLVCSVWAGAGQRGAGPPWLSARVTSPDGSLEQPGSHQGSAVLKPSPECSTCTDSSSGLGGEQLELCKATGQGFDIGWIKEVLIIRSSSLLGAI